MLIYAYYANIAGVVYSSRKRIDFNGIFVIFLRDIQFCSILFLEIKPAEFITQQDYGEYSADSLIFKQIGKNLKNFTKFS